MKEVTSRLLVNNFHSWYVVYEGIENEYLQNSPEFQLHTKIIIQFSYVSITTIFVEDEIIRNKLLCTYKGVQCNSLYVLCCLINYDIYFK